MCAVALVAMKNKRDLFVLPHLKNCLLIVPRVSLKSAGARPSQHQAPDAWNSLPLNILVVFVLF